MTTPLEVVLAAPAELPNIKAAHGEGAKKENAQLTFAMSFLKAKDHYDPAVRLRKAMEKAMTFIANESGSEGSGASSSAAVFGCSKCRYSLEGCLECHVGKAKKWLDKKIKQRVAEADKAAEKALSKSTPEKLEEPKWEEEQEDEGGYEGVDNIEEEEDANKDEHGKMDDLAKDFLQKALKQQLQIL